MWQTSNPTLNNDIFNQVYGKDMFAAQANVTTLQGVVQKTSILVSIAIAAGALGYWLFAGNSSVLWISSIAALIVGLGIGFVLCGKPQLAVWLAPVYAVVQGIFLGAFTALADAIIASRGLSVMLGGVGAQALIITASVTGVMLVLYTMRIVQPTQRFKAVIVTATGAIMLAYLVSFVMSWFGMSLPLLSFGAAVSESGWMGLLGLGVSVFILIIASLWLIIDFGTIEEQIKAGAPRYMEWYCGFALLVTLAWIYFESVKLVVRLALIFGDRR